MGVTGGRYSAEEVGQLSFVDHVPDAGELGRSWHRMLDAANTTIAVPPPDQVGTCVLDSDGELLRARPGELATALEAGHGHFHRGNIRGALPRLVDAEPG